MGRPSNYSQKVADLICEELAEGKSVRQICAAANMPACSTVFKWLAERKEFSEQYAHARELQAEHYANEIIEISDEVPTCQVPDPDGGVSERIDSAGIQRNRLRVDARKWIASKLLPKKYGDKVQAEVSGPDGGPVQAQITVEFVKPVNSQVVDSK